MELRLGDEIYNYISIRIHVNAIDADIEIAYSITRSDTHVQNVEHRRFRLNR